MSDVYSWFIIWMWYDQSWSRVIYSCKTCSLVKWSYVFTRDMITFNHAWFIMQNRVQLWYDHFDRAWFIMQNEFTSDMTTLDHAWLTQEEHNWKQNSVGIFMQLNFKVGQISGFERISVMAELRIFCSIFYFTSIFSHEDTPIDKLNSEQILWRQSGNIPLLTFS